MEVQETIKVNKRDFVRQFSQYLNSGGLFCLTIKGKEVCEVEIRHLSDNFSEEGIEPKVLELKKSIKEITETKLSFKKEELDKHGCGCSRGEKMLCPKHGRY